MFRPKKIPPPEQGNADNQVAATQTVIIPEPLRKVLCLLATETWRLQRKIRRLSAESSPDELAGIAASINRMDSGLRDFGVECREYTDQPYDPGMHLTVLAYEQVEGTQDNREVVIQTIAPGVFWGGQLIQQGEVVVSSGLHEREGE